MAGVPHALLDFFFETKWMQLEGDVQDLPIGFLNALLALAQKNTPKPACVVPSCLFWFTIFLGKNGKTCVFVLRFFPEAKTQSLE